MMALGCKRVETMDEPISISSGSDDSDIEILGVVEDGKNRTGSLTGTEWRSCAARNHRRNGIPEERALYTNICDYGQINRIFMDSQSPSCAVTEDDKKACEYSNSLIVQSQLKYPCHPPSEPLGKQEIMTPEYLFDREWSSSILSPIHCPIGVLNQEETRKRINSTTWIHPRKFPDNPEDRSCQQTQECLRYCTSQSALLPDLHVKQESPDSLGTLLLHPTSNTTTVPFKDTVGHSSYSDCGGFADNTPLVTEVKVEAAESKIPDLEKVKMEECVFPDPANSPSPVKSYSPYYCPSEGDLVEFSDFNSIYSEQTDNTLCAHSPHASPRTVSSNLQLGELDQFSQQIQPHSPGANDLVQQLPSTCQSRTGCISPSIANTPIDLGPRYSPISTYSVSGDCLDLHLHDVELPSVSPPSPHSSFCSVEINVSNSGSPHGAVSTAVSSMQSAGAEEIGREPDTMGLGSREVSRQDRCYVSRLRLKKLRHPARKPPQVRSDKASPSALSDARRGSEDEGSEEEVGCPVPLCRQNLSLVSSTMEENYLEGTLQLLSDFLHPTVWPPAEVTSHLLRGILLNPQCSVTLATEAYLLLMRIQRYHPANQSTVPWDWELLSSVMDSEGPSRSLQGSILHMLLQYVVQTMEDDFAIRLSEQRLYCSIVKAALSCDRRFSCIRDVIGWLVSAVKNSTGDSMRHKLGTEAEKLKDMDENLKIVLLLQKMLKLAVEVDCSPTCSCSKLSQDLFQMLISVTPLRQHRMLLLETLESSLLRCKLLEVLIEHSCVSKVRLPMSLRLLLHFIQYAEPPSDPSDGMERWRSWCELVHLLLMLLHSYQEVKECHLRLSITERASYSRPPIHTENDHITEAAVQEAECVFLSRVSADLGPTLPLELRESFSLLKDHLLDVCQQ